MHGIVYDIFHHLFCDLESEILQFVPLILFFAANLVLSSGLFLGRFVPLPSLTMNEDNLICLSPLQVITFSYYFVESKSS